MPDGPDDSRDFLVSEQSTRLTPAAFQADAGRVLVPVKPSAEMLAAGARAADVSVEAAWRVYQAMVASGGEAGDDGVVAGTLAPTEAPQPPRAVNDGS